jgi:hypothetical protein
VYIIGFLSQWKVYLNSIPAGPDAKNFTGRKLDATVYEKVPSLCLSNPSRKSLTRA